MREQIAPLEPLTEKPVRKFGGAQPGAGRPLGALNKVTADLKRQILDGAIDSDYGRDPNDKNAPGSMANYLRNVANHHPELYFQAVTKLLPKEVRTHLSNDTTVDITYHTIDEVKQALEMAGMSRTQIDAIAALLPDTGKPLDAA